VDERFRSKLLRHARCIRSAGNGPTDNRNVFQLTASDKTPIKSSAFKLFFEASFQSSDLFVCMDFRDWQAALQADSDYRQINGTRSPSGATAGAPNLIS
jgi:hypothetical protein